MSLLLFIISFCIIPQATCCSDHAHCCPHGYKCGSRTGTCSRGLTSFSWFTKTKAEPIVQETIKDVPCPGGSSSCPDNTTCCQMKSGAWACCPMPKVCCNNIIAPKLVEHHKIFIESDCRCSKTSQGT